MYSSDDNHTQVNTNTTELDFSRLNFSKATPIWEIKPAGEVAVKSVVIGLLVILSVVGNITVIYIISKTKKLQTATNLFILNVAVADLLTSCYTSWTFLIYDIYQDFILGSVFCKMDATVEITSMLASTFSLTVISCDRVLGIVFRCYARMKKRTALFIISVIWLAAVCFSLPPLYHREYKERQWADHLEKYCSEDKGNFIYYWIVLITVMMWLPLTIMTIAYSFIIFKLDHYENVMTELQRHKHRIKHRKRVTKMLFTILCTFFLCSLPFQIIVMYRSSRDLRKVKTELPDWYSIAFFIAHCFTLCNCALNPIIYSLSNERFRLALRDNCSCKKKAKVHPSIKIIYTPPIT